MHRDNIQHLGVLWSNNIVLGLMPRTLRAWKDHSSLNTCPNGASEDLIGIYARMDADGVIA